MADDRLGMRSARPGDLRRGLPSHDGEKRAFLFGVQLVLQVRQQTSSLDTGVQRQSGRRSRLKMHVTVTK